MRYLASMRFLIPLFCILLAAGCSRSISNDGARDAILEIPRNALEKEDIEVVKVTRVGGSQAVAETRLKTAFRIEKVHGDWIVREVRFGHGEWQRVDDLAEALESVRTHETEAMFDRIAEAIRKYRESAGELPEFKDYVALSDRLSPAYLTPLVRLDAWRRPLRAERTQDGSILLRSDGPDGKPGTPDDVRRTVAR